MTVYKYELWIDDFVSIQMPVGAEVLHVDVQRGQPCIWARVDPTAGPERRIFRVARTGHPLDPAIGPHIGSFQMHDGELVFHVFEVTR